MQFGLMTSAWKLLMAEAETLDKSNFSALYLVDHPAMEILPPWNMLAYMAGRTSRIGLGTHVTGAPFYHPTQLAKQVAAVDILSGGRARLGIGAGWTLRDFEPFGFRYPTITERLDLLEESLQIIKALWTQESVAFEGRIFQLRGGAQSKPRPVQEPHPPIIVGANTKGRILRIAASCADEFNTWMLDPEQVRDLKASLDEACRAIGREPASLRLTSDVLMMRGGTAEAAQGLAAQIATGARAGGRGTPATNWLVGSVLYGDEDAMAEQIRRFAAVGVQELTVSVSKLEDILWFSERVAAKFR